MIYIKKSKIRKKFLLFFILITVLAFNFNSCRKNNTNIDPTPTPSGSINPTPTPSNSDNPNPEPTPTDNPNPNKDIEVFFNNAYKGLASENSEVIKNDPKSPYKIMKNIINDSKEKIDIAIYDLGDSDIAQPFVNAYKRGVKIRVVTDTDNANKQGLNLLKNAGIPIISDNRSPIMHNKFMIVDNNLVWTGSMNLTGSSLYEHNNVSLLYKSSELANYFQKEFNDMFEKKIFDGNNHGYTPSTIIINQVPTKTFFSPKSNTKNAIVEELKKAKKSIKFMAFSFTDKDIEQVMIDKNNNNVKVQGIFDGCQLSSQYSTFNSLKNAKVEVYKDGNQALMHEKNIVIDDEIVITGSFNFSANADKNNNENCMFIKSPEIAKSFLEEFDKLKVAAQTNTNLPPYNSPGCGAE
ncbi:MAG: phospholipase D-like domain-containing protein [Candidatus Sericytochromatia bacterium]